MRANAQVLPLNVIDIVFGLTMDFSRDQTFIKLVSIGVNFFRLRQKRGLNYPAQRFQIPFTYFEIDDFFGVPSQGIYHPIQSLLVSNEGSHLIHFVFLAFQNGKWPADSSGYAFDALDYCYQRYL